MISSLFIGSRFCGFQRSATLERQKRFAFINQNTRVGKGTWPLPITVGWKSLLPDHVISRADQEEVIVSCLRVSEDNCNTDIMITLLAYDYTKRTASYLNFEPKVRI